MSTIPALETKRLILDGFAPEDAGAVERLVSDENLSRYTLNIPYPYPPGAAAAWIAGHAGEFRRGEGAAFAVRLPDRQVVGCMGLRINAREHDRGELGYWIGPPFWGRGYATEAARACLGFGFRHFLLHKIVANYVSANVASGRVMEKLGMTREGERPQHTKKHGVYHDLIDYGLLRAAFEAGTLLSRRSGFPPSARVHPALRGH